MKLMGYLVGVLLCLATQVYGQKDVNWHDLEVNKLQEKVDSAKGITFDMPVFSEKQLSLHKVKVRIKGYMSLMDSEDLVAPTLYLLQRYQQFDYDVDYPLDAVIEIRFKKEPLVVNATLKSTIVGTLILNEDDYMHPFYILEKAKIKN